MDKHFVIAGGGRVGEEIASVLSKKSHNFVIIESDENVAQNLRKKGYFVLIGDATKESLLKEAKVEKAKKIIITLPKTELNILITLTAKELNPKIEVYSRSEDPSLVSKLKRAGAKIVIVPEVIAGDELVKSMKIK